MYSVFAQVLSHQTTLDSKFRYFAEHGKTAENARLGQGLDLDPNPDSA